MAICDMYIFVMCIGYNIFTICQGIFKVLSD